MALELFFHFRRGLNGFYLAGLQGDRLQFLPTEAFAAQLEHRSIIKDAVQCAEQGGVLVEILAPQRRISVAGENHVEVAFLVVAAVNQIKEHTGTFLVELAVSNLINNETGRPHQTIETVCLSTNPLDCTEFVAELGHFNEINLHSP